MKKLFNLKFDHKWFLLCTAGVNLFASSSRLKSGCLSKFPFQVFSQQNEMQQKQGAALVVLLPDELTWQLQQLRAQHDKAHSRWPPHMTVFFPFPFASADVVAGVSKACKETASFSVRLASVSRNDGSKYICVNADEDGAKSLTKLRDAIAKTLKMKDEGGKWAAHTTIGQCSQGEADGMVETMQQEWQPIEFTVTELAILHKDEKKGIYKPVAKIPLK